MSAFVFVDSTILIPLWGRGGAIYATVVLSVLLRLPRLDQVCVQSFDIWEARTGGAHFARFRRLVSPVLMALVSHPLKALVLPVLRGTTSFSTYWFQLSCCRSWRQCRFMMPAVGHIGVMAHLCRPWLFPVRTFLISMAPLHAHFIF